jgi:O-antigen/teichoic acid export membrane protein
LRLLRSSLYTNTAYLWLGEIFFALLGFAFWAVVARFYSPEAVGLSGAAIASLVLLGQVAQLGLGYALIRFIPANYDDALLLMGRSLVAVVIASLLAGLVFLGSLPLWSQDLRDLLWQGPVHAGAFLVFVVFASVWALLTFTFIAYRSGISVMAQRLTVGVLRIPLAVLLGGLGTAFGIVAGHGLAVVGGTLLLGLVFLPRCTGRWRPPLALDVWRLAPVVPFAVSNLASHLLSVLAWQLLPLPVVALAGAEAAGYFYVAWAVAGIVLIMTQQLSLVLFAEGSSQLQGFVSKARGVLLLGVALGSLFAIVVFFLGDFILLLFGKEYVDQSSGVLKVLAAATPLAAVTHVYLGLERVRGRMLPLVAVSTVVTICMLGTTTGLVPRFGILGAGYGVLAAYGVGALLSLSFLYLMTKQGHRFIEPSQSKAV